MSTTSVIYSAEEDWLRTAVVTIQAGGLVAFPTDTVYGLGCDAFNATAVMKLYRSKDRMSEKAIPVLISSVRQLESVVKLEERKIVRIAEAFWPGPLTIIMSKHPNLPGEISPGSTVGVRVPAHPVALALIEAAGPLAVTSANLSGGRNAIEASEVISQLDGRFDLLVDGGTAPGGEPSTIIDATTDPVSLLRKGPISLDQIQRRLMSND